MRASFSTRFGFILAAVGSAVGLGNIWGFPTQVANNGGAAFVLAYLVLAFLLAYPVLMAELLIGRYTQANAVTAYPSILDNSLLGKGGITSLIGKAAGYTGILVASLILAFYAIVGGWVIAYLMAYVAQAFGWDSISNWVTSNSIVRNLIFCAIFYYFTGWIISHGVTKGIEKWSKRLLPTLLILIIALTGYVLTLEGAMQGLKVYLLPDFSKILNPELLISAMGQAFFSLSLGVGTMLIYGSYISKRENICQLGLSVAAFDIGIAILAGLLIIPAMFVAQANGVAIMSDGKFIGGDGLVFSVLPALFDRIQGLIILPIAFFLLLSVAAVTSSISMLEVPVAFTTEHTNIPRRTATWLLVGLIFSVSTTIIFHFDSLFGLAIQISTQFGQPLLGLFICLATGWIWKRNKQLEELKHGFPDIENSIFWKWWPFWVRFFCPAIILLMFWQGLAG